MLKISNKVKEKLYLISLFSIIFMYIIKITSGYHVNFDVNKFFLLIRVFAYSLLIVRLFFGLFSNEYRVKEIILYISFGVLILLSAYFSKLYAIIFFFLYIIGSKNVDYKKIIFVALISHAIGIMFVLLCCAFGLLDDNILGVGYRNRHCFGFEYTTDIANYYLYMVLYYLYLRQKNMKIYEYIVIIILNILIFKYTDTKSSFALILLSVIIAIFIQNVNIFSKYYKIYNFSVFVPILLFVFIMMMAVFYNKDISFFQMFNSILTNRLALSHDAIFKYGIKPFGQYIVFIGGEQLENPSIYNYVDPSFIKNLLSYGMVFTTLTIVYLTYFAKKINEKKDIYLLLCFVIFMIHSTFDPQLLMIEYNDFLFFLGL